LITDY